MSFKNKIVIVTGASSGIGAAIAVAMSAEGAKVVMVARNVNKMTEVATRCENPFILQADLSKEDDIRLIINKTIEKFGRLDVLVNNASSLAFSSLIDADNILKAFDINISIKLRAVVYLTSLAVPHIIKTKGNIINISGVGGLMSHAAPNLITFSVAEAGQNHFTTCAAAELASYGVRVNGISPGPVKTDLLINYNSPVDWDDLKVATALNRISEPNEIAELVLFLASDKANAITGANYVIDNGMMLKRA